MMRHPSRRPPGLAAFALVSALCATAADRPEPPAPLKPTLDALTTGGLLGHIKVLASDAFEGRGPGTPGEAKTVEYLTDQFRALGLKPGNPDGTYVQDVPLVGFKATDVKGRFTAGGTAFDLKFPEDWVAVTRRPAAEVKVTDSEVVFIGYGVVAPEFGWDDYKGLDVRGKTVLMLVNDPPVADPADPAKLDPSYFRGPAMTYYGRWTYKYEVASVKGAAAAVLIHETGPAGYPFQVVQGSWSLENFDIATPGQGNDRVAVESWVGLDKAKAILKAAGQDFDALKAAAAKKDFRPVVIDAKADMAVTTARRGVMSHNVVAKVEGSDPALRNQYVIYTAYWDHLGRDTKLVGDQIYNGAADNASGTAALLELAGAFARLDPKPKRSVLFLAVTAEEKGLLGAKYYASRPLYPLASTLADINMDVINLWGPTRDLVSLGLGLSDLDALVAEAAAAQGRTVAPDAEPEKGLFYRSDHFEFCKQGVPAVNARGGIDYVGRPADYGRRKRAEYTGTDYHKVTDEVKPDWNLEGAMQDLRLLAEVGYRIALGSAFPAWNPGTEFRARRDASLSAAGR